MPTQADYQRGVEIAEKKFGGECRDFDRAIWGVTEAINQGAAGRHVEPADVVHRWHYPLAGADSKHCLEHWQAAMATICAMPSVDSYEVSALFKGLGQDTEWRFRSAREAASLLTSSLAFDREVDRLIDSEIKRKYPAVRRKSRRYAELADSVRGQAQELTRKSLLQVVECRLGELRGWLDGDERRLRERVESDAAWTDEQAADVLALLSGQTGLPDCEAAKQMQARAREIRSRLARRIERHDQLLASLECLLPEVPEVPKTPAA